MSAEQRTNRWRWIPWAVVIVGTALVFKRELSSAHYLPKLLFAAFSLAAALLVLPPARRGRLSLTFLGLLWTGYLGWTLVTLLWAPQPRVGFERWLVLLIPTLGYLAARRSRFWESDGFWMVVSLLTIGLCALGVLQFAHAYVARGLNALVPGWGGAVEGWLRRFPGASPPVITMGQRNVASMFFMMVVPFLAWRYFTTRGWRCVLSYLAFGAGVLFVLLARSRGAWMACLAGLLFVFAAGLWPRLRRRRRRLAWLAAMAVPALIAGLILKPTDPEEFGTSKQDLTATAANVMKDAGRLQVMKDALAKSNLVIGGGFGNFGIVTTPKLEDDGIRTLDWEIHNDYLQAWVDTGVPGALLFTAVFAWLIGLGWKGRRDPLVLAGGAAVVGLALMQATTYTLEKIPQQLWLAGVAAVLNRPPRARWVVDRPLWRPVPWLLGHAAAVYLVGFGILVAFAVRGDRLLRRTEAGVMQLTMLKDRLRPHQRAVVERRIVRDIGMLRDDVVPSLRFHAKMRHIYYHKYVGYCMMLNDPTDAEFFAAKALELHPCDRACMDFLARRCFQTGRRAEGVAMLERYVDTFGVDPDSELVRGLVQIYRVQGRPDKAAELQAAIEHWTINELVAVTPSNRTARVPCDVTFDWNDAGREVDYDLYLWKTGEQTPASPIARGLKESEFRPRRPLLPDTVYFWRVTARNRHKSRQSEIFFFRTGEPSFAKASEGKR